MWFPMPSSDPLTDPVGLLASYLEPFVGWDSDKAGRVARGATRALRDAGLLSPGVVEGACPKCGLDHPWACVECGTPFGGSG